MELTERYGVKYKQGNVYGGVGLPVLCYGRCTWDGTNFVVDEPPGGGSLLPSQKMQSIYDQINKTTPTEYADGSVAPARIIGWRLGWKLTFVWYHPCVEMTALRDMINMALISNGEISLRFYPQGNPDISYPVYVSSVSPSFYQESLFGEAIIVELKTFSTSGLDNTIVPEEIDPVQQIPSLLMMEIDGEYKAEEEDGVLGWGYPEEVKPILVLSPNGGETWKVGEKHDITWTGNSALVKLHYRIGIDDPVLIEDNVPNTGSYEWTIPNAPSDAVVVIVTNHDDPTDTDQSDATFTIFAVMSILILDLYFDGSSMIDRSANPLTIIGGAGGQVYTNESASHEGGYASGVKGAGCWVAHWHSDGYTKLINMKSVLFKVKSDGKECMACFGSGGNEAGVIF